MLARHPLAERLAGMLMVAWSRRGRQADALRVFRDLRGRLASELAVEPGPELQRLHQRILSGDPALAAPGDLAGPLLRGGEAAAPADGPGRDAAIWHTRPPQPADAPQRPGSGKGAKRAGTPGNRELGIEAGPGLNQPVLSGIEREDSIQAAGGAGGWLSAGLAEGAAVPRQLPAVAAGFTGRVAELAVLDGLLDQAAGCGGPVVISAIGGTAGVGKTALATYWAHRVADRFPDGQLYVNLRGFGPSGTPVSPAAAVRLFLDGLGVEPERVPAGLDAQAALYRSVLAGRRMLIVADNARDPEQVRPLLPGTPGCLVVVTSRNQFAGLAAAEGAHLISLDVLTEPEALELLSRRLGRRAAAEPGAVAELARLCARLPLALSIAAARGGRPARAAADGAGRRAA